LTVWVAQYLLWLMAAGYLLVWLFEEDRRGRVQFAVQTVVGVVLAVGLLYIAKSVHHDPRPFVQNPRITPWFHHGADDGFPSDHSLGAAVLATLMIWRHRIVGAAMVVGALLIGWARVAAHVHHAQDVIAGLLLGALAAVLAHAVLALIRMWRRRDRSEPKPSVARPETGSMQS